MADRQLLGDIRIMPQIPKLADWPLSRQTRQAITGAADGLVFGIIDLGDPFEAIPMAIAASHYDPRDASTSPRGRKLYQGASFLMQPAEQAEWMKTAGYPAVNDGDYGLVSKAVRTNVDRTGYKPNIYEWSGSDRVDPRNLERSGDIIYLNANSAYSPKLSENSDGSLTLIPDFPEGRNLEIKLEDSGLTDKLSSAADLDLNGLMGDAHTYPVSTYTDKKTGQSYLRAYDFNNYGERDGKDDTDYWFFKGLANWYNDQGYPFIVRATKELPPKVRGIKSYSEWAKENGVQ